ncbi:hypothetical protein MVEN_01628700 [Mycena venus]|uniref:Secreted protein n=1 Tax=Mycena venus TaxID=2733690 RepID=A0A8H6XQ33_9AGAR|nr:hypothetical protein MVEN_01628700 [Mycena venus]
MFSVSMMWPPLLGLISAVYGVLALSPSPPAMLPSHGSSRSPNPVLLRIHLLGVALEFARRTTPLIALDFWVYKLGEGELRTRAL